jgi:hypothetical protein
LHAELLVQQQHYELRWDLLSSAWYEEGCWHSLLRLIPSFQTFVHANCPRQHQVVA